MRPQQTLVGAGAPERAQRGAATLVVVMVLFVIMAMMAAYANRNLVFEQRIASNYYRSGVALEAAEAGTEWALAMLNGVSIDAACVPAVSAAASSPGNSFRERYLGITPATRALTPVLGATTSASCVRTAAQGWICQCPAGAWVPANVDDANQMQPSFDIVFQPAGRAGVVRIVSYGCTSSQSTQCRISNQVAANNQLLGGANVRIEAALVSALKMPPAMPLTIRQNIDTGAGDLGLHNGDPRSSGLLLLTGGGAPTLNDARLDSLPGTPGSQALISNDAGLNAAAADGMFAMFFGMAPAQYQAQPAMRSISCSGDCAPALLAAYSQGMRMIWVDGPMTLSSNVTLGTATSPLLLVANGNVTINGPLILNGLLYARGNISWANGSGQLAMVNGAMLGEGSLQVTGKVDLWYQASIMDLLSNASGSFVRVPGSWWDAGGD